METGDYVRTKSNGIQKIDEEGRINLGLIRPHFSIIKKEEIIKSSSNIIDLIEVGDYVNGYMVKAKDEKENKVYFDYLKKSYPANIKTVFTKEQFESMKYEIK